MSGRDLRKFVNFHRNAIGATDSTLVNRFIEGHGSNRYKPADYDKLQAIARLRKAAGNQTLQKVEKITKASKEKKEQNLLQQHKACWLKERIRLSSLQRKLQSEIDSLRPGSPLDYSSIKEFFQDLEIYEGILGEDTKEFKKNTIQPLWDLREDLQFWLGENRDRLLMGVAEKEHSEVLQVVQSVRLQQQAVMDKLQMELQQIEGELDSVFIHELTGAGTTPEVTVEMGIPEEALELTCPDEQLKLSILEEFSLLDKKYEAQLEFLSVKYQHVKYSSTDGWSKDDHFHFLHLMEQYPPDIPNRRSLYIDRMLRELSHKTRPQLVEHEEWYLAHKFCQEQCHSTVRAWASHKEELMIKVKATFLDAWAVYEEAEKQAQSKKKQETICQELYEKVLQFREQKLEALRLQSAIAAKQQEEEERRLRVAEEKERRRRDLQHQKIKEYHDQKQRERDISAEEERKQLAELQQQMAEQAVKDRERVKYREEQFMLQQEAKKQAKEQALDEERLKQRRLDKLREQVQVHVEDDPERLFKPTEASQARVASIYEEELDLQQPLFSLHGYNDKQVDADSRLKVEKALREAGLHNTAYARKIMATIKPPHEHRKDQHSTVLKFD